MSEGYLPPGRDVDVGVLASLFKKTSSSYKYLYFLALLELVREAKERPDPLWFSEEEVGYRALALAWFPNVKHRLVFGKQDRVQRILDGAVAAGGRASAGLEVSAVEARLRETVEREEFEGFLKQVPQRLIRPFLRKQLHGLPDSRIDGAIPRVSEAAFDTAVPLYRLVGRRLEIHPSWRRYFTRHGSVVRGWALWHWAEYMERRNPTHYGVHLKLFPPPGREALGEQRRFWGEIVTRASMRCPYSGLPLEDFELDHILPWSFQPNDRLWILVPAARRANAAKGDRLPDLSRYLGALAATQATGLVTARNAFPPRVFRRFTESYRTDLVLEDDLVDHAPRERVEEALEDAYSRQLTPLISLARNQGFETGWRWPEAG